jgi:hypothetical protein
MPGDPQGRLLSLAAKITDLGSGRIAGATPRGLALLYSLYKITHVRLKPFRTPPID